MNQQFFHQGTLVKQLTDICSTSHTISQKELKNILLKFAIKIHELEKSVQPPQFQNPSFGNSNMKQNRTNEILQVIQAKIIEMEERRKMWDSTMAEIYNERIVLQKKMKGKLEQLDHQRNEFQRDVKSMKQFLYKSISQAEQDKKVSKMVLTDKISKIKAEVGLQVDNKLDQFQTNINKICTKLEQKYIEINQNQQRSKNRFQFVVNCRDLVQSIQTSQKLTGSVIDNVQRAKYKNNHDIDINNEQIKISNQKTCLQNLYSEINNPYYTQPTLQKNYSEPNSTPLVKQNKLSVQGCCQNMLIIVNNIRMLSELQNSVQQSTKTIQRFQNKIINLGEKMEIIENKMGSIFDTVGFGSRKVNTMKQQEQKSPKYKMQGEFAKNKEFPNLSQSYFQIQASNFINTDAKFINRFKIQGPFITYLDDGVSCVLFGLQKIRLQKRFSIRIKKMKQKFISVGIVDQKYQYQRDCWGQSNFIFLRGKGQVFGGNNNKPFMKNTTFKPEDVVTVAVDCKAGRIQWFINGRAEATFEDMKITVSHIQWVPMVRFYNRDDCIQWISLNDPVH